MAAIITIAEAYTTVAIAACIAAASATIKGCTTVIVGACIAVEVDSLEAFVAGIAAEGRIAVVV